MVPELGAPLKPDNAVADLSLKRALVDQLFRLCCLLAHPDKNAKSNTGLFSKIVAARMEELVHPMLSVLRSLGYNVMEQLRALDKSACEKTVIDDVVSAVRGFLTLEVTDSQLSLNRLKRSVVYLWSIETNVQKQRQLLEYYRSQQTYE